MVRGLRGWGAAAAAAQAALAAAGRSVERGDLMGRVGWEEHTSADCCHPCMVSAAHRHEPTAAAAAVAEVCVCVKHMW